MATISIVVPCRNEEQHIELLLEGIRAQSRAADEILIVDGGSTDSTRERIADYARRHPSPPILLLTELPVPIPVALNMGINAASGEVIVRLDAHCQPEATYIERAVGALEGSSASVVGGVWRIAAGGDTATARAIALAVGHPLGAGDASYRLGVAGDEPRQVDTVPFGCFRKTLWQSLAGFDERLGANEDYDFNYRARQTGAPVLLVPHVRSVYFARATIRALAAQYLNYGWWKAQVLKRHPRSLRWRQAIPPIFVLVVGFLSLASIDSRTGAAGLLLAALAAYAATLAIGAIDIRRRTQAPWNEAAIVPLALAVVHSSWGVGLLWGLVAKPRRRLGRVVVLVAMLAAWGLRLCGRAPGN